MDKYVCLVCGYIYDAEIGDSHGGIAPGTKFEDIPDEWVCPICGVHMIELPNTRFNRHTVKEHNMLKLLKLE